MGNAAARVESDAPPSSAAPAPGRLPFLTPVDPAAAVPPGDDADRVWFEYRWQPAEHALRRFDSHGGGHAAATKRSAGDDPGPAAAVRASAPIVYHLDCVRPDGGGRRAAVRVHLSRDARGPHRLGVPRDLLATDDEDEADLNGWLPPLVPADWLQLLAAAARGGDTVACAQCSVAPALCRLPRCGHRCLCPRCLLRQTERPRCPLCRTDLFDAHPHPLTHADLARWVDLDFPDPLLDPAGRAWSDAAGPTDVPAGDPRDRLALEDAVHRAVEALEDAAGPPGRLRSGRYAVAEREVWAAESGGRAGRSPGAAAETRAQRVQRLARAVWERLPEAAAGRDHQTWAKLERYVLTRAADRTGSRGGVHRLATFVRRAVRFERAVLGPPDHDLCTLDASEFRASMKRLVDTAIAWHTAERTGSLSVPGDLAPALGDLGLRSMPLGADRSLLRAAFVWLLVRRNVTETGRDELPDPKHADTLDRLHEAVLAYHAAGGDPAADDAAG